MSDTTVQVFKDAAGAWRWRAVARNHETVATGESHGSRSDATRAARRAFPDAELVEP